MDLRQLEYLVAVAEEANFTRAAERVHVSQSGVSSQVRRLEEELGAALFDRSERVVRLTAAGTAALEPARRALAEAAAVRRAVDEVNGLVRGRLSLGMLHGCAIGPWLDAVAGFGRRHPGVELVLREADSAELVAGVTSGGLDAALVAVAGAVPPDLSSLVLVSEPPVAVVGPDRELSDPVTLRRLAGERLISLPPGTGIRTAFLTACSRRGIEPTIGLVASSPEAVGRLAGQGLGVGILSASSIGGEQDGLRPVTIDGADVPAIVAVVWRADGAEPAVTAFVDGLAGQLSPSGPPR